MRLGFWLCVVLLLLSVGLACGGGSGSGDTAQFRFVQGSPDAPGVDLVVDRTTQSADMLYGNASAYVSVKTGTHQIKVVKSGSTSAVYSATMSFSSATNQTLFLTGPVAQLKPVVLKDGGTSAPTGDGSVRVVIITSQMGPADVYITTGGASLAGSTPIATNIALDQDTGYQSVLAGAYQVFVTAPGTKNVYITTGSLTLTAAQNHTIVIFDAPVGGFTFADLQDSQ